MALILVDNRGGSEGEKAIVRDLLNPLIAAGLPAVLSRMDSADIAFVGKGANGTSLDIGIELKRLDGGSTDLTQSLRSGRLAGHQLPKMVGPNGAYDYGFLCVEGIWSHDDHGQVVVEQGKKRKLVQIRGHMSASAMEKQLLTLELCGGLHVRYTNTRRDTIRFIGSLYRWFSDKPFDAHDSHLAFHNAPTLIAISPFRQAVAQFPGVGVRLSKAVEAHFGGSLRKAVMAGVDEWSEITSLTDAGKSRRLGNALAARIVNFCKGTK